MSHYSYRPREYDNQIIKFPGEMNREDNNQDNSVNFDKEKR